MLFALNILDSSYTAFKSADDYDYLQFGKRAATRRTGFRSSFSYGRRDDPRSPRTEFDPISTVDHVAAC